MPVPHLSGHTPLSKTKLNISTSASTTVLSPRSLLLFTASAAVLRMSVRIPSSPGALPILSLRMALNTSMAVMGASSIGWCWWTLRIHSSRSSTSRLYSSS